MRKASPRGRPKGGPTREARRQELLAAAIEVIRREGPDASMEAFADQAGVTKPVLYNHFGDKAGLAVAVSGAVADQLTAELVATTLAGFDQPGPQNRAARRARTDELVRGALDAFLGFVEREPNLFHFVVHPPGATDPKREAMALVDQASEAIALALSSEATARLDGPAAGLAARAVVGGAYVVAEWWERDRPVDRDEVVAQLTSFVAAGIRALES